MKHLESGDPVASAAAKPPAGNESVGRAGGEFFPRIESLRGLAALMVASGHAWQSPWRDAAGTLRTFYVPAPDVDGPILAAITPYLRVFNNGGGAVNIFFVISGFVLAISLSRGSGTLADKAGRFSLSRLFRIYPAVMATVGIFVLLYWTLGVGLSGPEQYGALSVVTNLLLIEVGIDGVMWSLQVELVALPAIFFAFALHRAWGNGAVILLFVLLAAASFAGGLMPPHTFYVTSLYAFIGGMLALYASRGLVEAFSGLRSALVFAAAFAAMLCSRLTFGFASNWAAVIEAAMACVVVAYLAFGEIGLLGRLFDNRLVRFYGRISYSLYLLHPLTLIVIHRMPDAIGALVRMGLPTALIAFGLAAVTIAAVTPLAWLMYLCVERPGVALGRSAWRRARSAYSPAPTG